MEPQAPKGLQPPLLRLTCRDLELLFLRSQGVPLKEIAYRWRVSEKRVRNLSSLILKKTGCRSTTQVVALLLETGIAKPSAWR